MMNSLQKMRLFKYFCHYFTYEARFCKSAKKGLPPPRRRKPFCVLYLRHCLFIAITLFLLGLHYLTETHKAKFAILIPSSAYKFLFFNETQYNALNSSDLKRLMEERNRELTAYSSKVPYQEYMAVLVIFVKGFTLQLKYLLASLSNVQDIHRVLIVFSHSVYDENANHIIKSIDFCTIIQIYYPYTLQLYPHTFPDFYKEGLEGAKMRRKKRDAYRSEGKNHWWWTVNQVFERLIFSTYYDGLVVFFKDEYFFLKDFLYMLQAMHQYGKLHSDIDFYSLATPKPVHFHNYHNGVEVMSWNSNHHGDVLAFDYVTWDKIVPHFDLFCSSNDYDWMVSLLQVSLEQSSAFRVISCVLPRAYKISYTGMLQEQVVFERVYSVLELQRLNNKSLFPPLLDIYDHKELIAPELTADFKHDLKGGWDDPIDIDLCRNITEWKIKKFLYQTAHELREY